jgi:hypothetical protein
MTAGFLLAKTLHDGATIALAVAFEVLFGLHIRDNLTLNVIMLIHPFEAIRTGKQGRLSSDRLPPPRFNISLRS